MHHEELSRMVTGRELFVAFAYLLATFLFIYGLVALTKPVTARRGNLLAAVGMLVAIIGTLVQK